MPGPRQTKTCWPAPERPRKKPPPGPDNQPSGPARGGRSAQTALPVLAFKVRPLIPTGPGFRRREDSPTPILTQASSIRTFVPGHDRAIGLKVMQRASVPTTFSHRQRSPIP